MYYLASQFLSHLFHAVVAEEAHHRMSLVYSDHSVQQVADHKEKKRQTPANLRVWWLLSSLPNHCFLKNCCFKIVTRLEKDIN